MDENSRISLDDICEILVKTVVHPAYVWSGVVLCLQFVEWSWNSYVLAAAAAAVAVDLVWVARWFNIRFISGPRRDLDPSKDVILVTGGSYGLGRYIAALLAVKNFNVAILDIREPKIDLPGAKFYKCDVSDVEQVRRVHQDVERDLGTVTVLVNNAGIVSNQTVFDLSEELIERTIGVNLLSHFWTIKTFVPAMVKLGRGHIVTISSTIGCIGPSRLCECDLAHSQIFSNSAAYAASKGGLNLFHDSVSHELAGTGVRSLLVSVGQMDSELFAGVKTPNDFLAPVVPTVNVASSIVDALLKGQAGEIALPVYAKLLPWTKVIPSWITEVVRTAFGMDHAMETFRGRQD